jgi:zinc D-Ala-D-Ala carboxypeptidase
LLQIVAIGRDGSRYTSYMFQKPKNDQLRPLPTPRQSGPPPVRPGAFTTLTTLPPKQNLSRAPVPSQAPEGIPIRRKVIIGLVIALVILTGVFIASRLLGSDKEQPTSAATSTQQASFNKSRYPTDQAGSLWWVVNKSRPVGNSYVPDDLVVPSIPIRSGAGADERQVSQKVAGPLEQMVAAAKQSGIQLLLASGYRSYGLQQSVYAQNVKQLGQTEADKVSAKPGTSEHQTGLSFDIGAVNRKCEIETCFAETPEGQWVAQHAHEYGFIIRYAEGKQDVTGYNFEPWHLRYVGTELAAELKKQNIQTLEEFFGP